MRNTRRLSAALSSAALVAGLLTMTAARAAADPVKLTGCLVKGDDGFLLVNPPMEPASTPTVNRSETPGTVGTAGVFANVFYWLDKDDDLTPHIGHRVEVEGDLRGDVKAGEIRSSVKTSGPRSKSTPTGAT